jgi:xylulose-5-phosphate/fructose-6-phosphate phosphoketolase
MQRLFKQFSFPGGVPSHVAAEVGASFPRAESSATPSRTPSAPHSTTLSSSWPAWWATARPRRARWRRAGTRTSPEPAIDGAVLPVLHLNGYKISSPSLFARIEPEELESLLVGYGWTSYSVEGS